MDKEKELFGLLRRQFTISVVRKCLFLFCLVICCLYIRNNDAFSLNSIIKSNLFIIMLMPILLFFLFEYWQYQRVLKQVKRIQPLLNKQQTASLIDQIKTLQKTRSCYTQIAYIDNVAVIYNCLNVPKIVELSHITGIKQSKRFHPPWKGNWKSYLLCIKANELSIRILLPSINECESFIKHVNTCNEGSV